MNYYKIAGITIATSGFEYEYFKDRMKAYEIPEVTTPDVTVYYEQALFPIQKPDYKHIVTTGGFREYFSDNGGYIFYDKFEEDALSCAKVEINADASVVHTALYDIEDIGGAPIDVRAFNMLGEVFRYCILRRNGMVVHSSSICHNGSGIIFSAPSGTGKSTHTSLWMKYYGDSTQMINDDCPAITFGEVVPYVNGTPWSGKHNISRNERVPLAGIAILQRGENNQIEPFNGILAIQAIMKQVNRPKFPEYRAKLMELLDKLITKVPIWRVQCNMDVEAAVVSYEAMSGSKIKK